MRDLEYKNDNAPGQQGNKDWFRIYNSNRSIEIGTKNGEKGDFIRVITRAPPVANNDAGYINETTLSVSNGAMQMMLRLIHQVNIQADVISK